MREKYYSYLQIEDIDTTVAYKWNEETDHLPFSYQRTLHLAQWTTSNALSGKGSFWVPITPKNAGIPRSNANCI
jgi:hypothetical protein